MTDTSCNEPFSEPFSDEAGAGGGGSAGKLSVWCSGHKNNVVNGYNVYYPLLPSDKVSWLLIELGYRHCCISL